MRSWGARLVVSVVAVIALAACSGASGGGGSHAAGLPDHFVGRYAAGAALLAWTNSGGRLAVTMDLTHTDPANPTSVVQSRLSLTGRLHDTNVTLQNSAGAPWSGSFRGQDLVLDWSPVGDRIITTTFTPGDESRYRTVAADFTREVAQIHQADARRSQVATAEAQQRQQEKAAAAADAQAAAAAHLAHAAASQQAHADQVAAQQAHVDHVAAIRGAHAAAVAAMQQRNALKQANAAAHHH